jgi:DNA-binding CsgD family transcriptional regulator
MVKNPPKGIARVGESKILIPQNFLNAIATEYGVSDSELKVLSLALEGVSTAAIAKQLGTRPEVIRNRLGEVYRKFQIPGSGPGKLAKLQQILVSQYHKHQNQNREARAPVKTEPPYEEQTKGLEPTEATPTPRIDWNEAPDVSIFYGRTKELATLEQWILQDNCRLVALLGMGGIGKTALSVRSAKQIADNFEYVIWRTLRHAPPLKEILAQLLIALSYPHKAYLPEDINQRISLLIESLQKHRCLLILDNTETILQSGELTGHYREGYETYGELFRRVGESHHQSCLLITSQEKPREIALLEGATLPVRSLTLTGLQPEDAGEIFKAKELSDSEHWKELIQRYQGNPLYLKIAATSIQELFQGKVSEFLKRSISVFGDIRVLLERQFERLSDLEQEILYWLAIEHQAVSLEQLQSNLWLPLAESDLFEVIESLGRRSLIEKVVEGSTALFTLQMVVMEYVTNELTEQLCTEIMSAIKTHKIEKLERFISLSLEKAQLPVAKPHEIPYPPIIQLMKNRMIAAFRSEVKLKEQLNKLLSMLPDNSSLEGGYARNNLQHLIAALPGK